MKIIKITLALSFFCIVSNVFSAQSQQLASGLWVQNTGKVSLGISATLYQDLSDFNSKIGFASGQALPVENDDPTYETKSGYTFIQFGIFDQKVSNADIRFVIESFGENGSSTMVDPTLENVTIPDYSTYNVCTCETDAAQQFNCDAVLFKKDSANYNLVCVDGTQKSVSASQKKKKAPSLFSK